MVCSASIGSAKAHQVALRNFFGHFLAPAPCKPPPNRSRISPRHRTPHPSPCPQPLTDRRNRMPSPPAAMAKPTIPHKAAHRNPRPNFPSFQSIPVPRDAAHPGRVPARPGNRPR